MPGVDWIPLVSQIKAGLQYVTGDAAGAGKTMDNFSKECPIISQAVSLGQLAKGDTAGALETWNRCVDTVSNVANGVPVVGHVKGGVHHLFGDHEGGNRALNAASRTTVVMGSGALAGLATGGLAAIPAGIAAGAGYDVVGSSITGESQGVVAMMEHTIKNPSAGTIFDAGAAFVGDALSGYSGAQVANKLPIAKEIQINRLKTANAMKLDQLNSGLLTDGQAVALGKEMNALTAQIDVLQKGPTPQYVYDMKTNEIVIEPVPKNMPPPPVVGVQESGQVKRTKAIMLNRREFAIDCDFYEDKEAQQVKLTKEQKQKIFDKHNEKQSDGSIKKIYSEINKFTNPSQSQSLLDFFEPPNEDSSQNTVESLFNNFYVHLRMPEQFPYTLQLWWTV